LALDEQTERRRAAPWNVLASRYDSLFRRPIDEAENRVVFAWVQRHIRRLDELHRGPAKVLDLGCGTALLLDYLRPGGYVGVDISGAMLDRAVTKHPYRTFLKAPMERLEVLGDATFHLAVSLFGAISHADPAATLDGLRAHLAPGAEVLLLVYSPRYRRRPSACWRQVDEAAEAGSYLELPAAGWRSLVEARFPRVQMRGFRYLPDGFWRGDPDVLCRRLELEMALLGGKLDGRVQPYWYMIEAGL
jgi:SAM-dependent methyltransferase